MTFAGRVFSRYEKEGTASHSSYSGFKRVKEMLGSIAGSDVDVEGGSGSEGCRGQARQFSSKLSRDRTSSELDFADVRLSETIPVRRMEST